MAKTQSQGPGLPPQDRNGSNAIKLRGFRMSARIERERVQLRRGRDSIRATNIRA